MKRFLFVFLIFATAIMSLSADRTLVIVGNIGILESDVRSKMAMEGLSHEDALDSLIIDNLLVYDAKREGVTVQEEELLKGMEALKKPFPDEKTFLAGLEREGISYAQFRDMVRKRILVRNIVGRKVDSKIRIQASEIMDVVQQLREQRLVSYNFYFKFFQDIEEAEKYVAGFEAENIKEMVNSGWLAREEIHPDIFEVLETLSKGEAGGPVKIAANYACLYLENVRISAEEDLLKLYRQARNIVFQRYFAEKFERYIETLKDDIPVLYSDK